MLDLLPQQGRRRKGRDSSKVHPDSPVRPAPQPDEFSPVRVSIKHEERAILLPLKDAGRDTANPLHWSRMWTLRLPPHLSNTCAGYSRTARSKNTILELGPTSRTPWPQSKSQPFESMVKLLLGPVICANDPQSFLAITAQAHCSNPRSSKCCHATQDILKHRAQHHRLCFIYSSRQKYKEPGCGGSGLVASLRWASYEWLSFCWVTLPSHKMIYHINLHPASYYCFKSNGSYLTDAQRLRVSEVDLKKAD